MSVTDSEVRSVNTTSSMSIAGSWSLSPMHAVSNNPKSADPGAAESCPRFAFQGFVHLLITVHFGNYGVAQIDPVSARRLAVEEMVETCRLEDVLGSQPQPDWPSLRRFSRNVAITVLDIPKYVH